MNRPQPELLNPGPNHGPGTSVGLIPLQMPLWQETSRALPTSFARSALFSIGGKNERRRMTDETVASWTGTNIAYTGEELRTDDEDVLMQLFHLARGKPIDPKHGIELGFSGYSLLQQLGWRQTKPYYERLKSCLVRLQTGSLHLTVNTQGRRIMFSGQLLRKFIFDEQGTYKAQWRVWIEPEVIKLFQPSFLEMDWDQRMRLRRSVSKWLHGFLSCESGDQVMRISQPAIRRLSGSTASTPAKFRQTLKDGLDELELTGAIGSWRLQGDDMYVAMQRGIGINCASAIDISCGPVVIEFRPAGPEEPADIQPKPRAGQAQKTLRPRAGANTQTSRSTP